jgi:putative tricarboxylic transport membrane protein
MIEEHRIPPLGVVDKYYARGLLKEGPLALLFYCYGSFRGLVSSQKVEMEKTSFGSERIAYLVVSMVSIMIMIGSLSYGLGTPRKPGSGLYSFGVGLFIFPLSLSLFISSMRSRKKDSILNREKIKTLLSLIGAFVFWIMVMPYLGYPIVTLITAFCLSKIMKLEGWLKPSILSAGMALFIYLLFDYWLYIDLPRGFWQ